MSNKKTEKQITTKDTKLPFDIPVEGSLGLLALGAVGIIEWKKVRNAANKKSEKK